MPNPFAAANFDPARIAPNDAVIFDDSGYLDTGGGYADTRVPVGDYQASFDDWIEDDFYWAGLGNVVWDIDAQFADATYVYAVNSAVSTSQGTTYYVDHGIQGTNGSDVVLDPVGDNVVRTGGGADLILVGGGVQYVDAGAGDDVVITGGGDDVVKLDRGDDWLWAGDGCDSVRAGDGNDTVIAGAGNDSVAGGGGNDRLMGDDGADVLNGGADDDRLEGGADNDTLVGGTGADVFVFAGGTGRDVVRDYQDGLDRIEIDTGSTGLTGFGDLVLTQIGNGVGIDLGGGDEIILRMVQMSDLTAADFDFV